MISVMRDESVGDYEIVLPDQTAVFLEKKHLLALGKAINKALTQKPKKASKKEKK